jgi:hypothetical protein
MRHRAGASILFLVNLHKLVRLGWQVIERKDRGMTSSQNPNTTHRCRQSPCIKSVRVERVLPPEFFPTGYRFMQP